LHNKKTATRKFYKPLFFSAACYPRSEKGFTLIEVLVAVAILATGLVLIVEGMGRSQQAIRIAENLVAASFVAEQQIVKSEMEVRSEHDLSFNSDRGKEKNLGRQFEWEKITQPYTDKAMEDETKVNEVAVTVEWKEAHRNNLMKVSSLILNREKQQ
jgi:type II secretion system protein I